MNSIKPLLLLILAGFFITAIISCSDDDSSASEPDQELEGEWNMHTFYFEQYDEEGGKLLDEVTQELEDTDFFYFDEDGETFTERLGGSERTGTYELLSSDSIKIDFEGDFTYPKIYEFNISGSDISMTRNEEIVAGGEGFWIEEAYTGNKAGM